MIRSWWPVAVLAGFLSVVLASSYLWAFGAVLAYGSLLLGAVFLLPEESRSDARGFLLVGATYLVAGHLFFALAS